VFERKYFIETLPLMVAGNGGFTAVRLQTYDGPDYLVRDVIETHEGSVTLNTYVDANGNTPIISSSSSMYDVDPCFPVGYVNITIPFENIRFVKVIPTERVFSQFHN
jgi:hypothetical protein